MERFLEFIRIHHNPLTAITHDLQGCSTPQEADAILSEMMKEWQRKIDHMDMKKRDSGTLSELQEANRSQFQREVRDMAKLRALLHDHFR